MTGPLPAGRVEAPCDDPTPRVFRALYQTFDLHTVDRRLAAHGLTGIYTAATARFAVVSVTAGLTVWTNGHQLWYTQAGQRRTWPATDIATAAAQIAALARP
jgi:hypothetical protein